MLLAQIRAMPTEVTRAFVTAHPDSQGFHESLTRSYHIVAKVKELLECKCPPDILLSIIDDLEVPK